MAFRLMRYSMAVMQRHIEQVNAGRYRWSSRCCFITVAVALSLVPVLAGRICRPGYRTEVYNAAFPLVDVTVVPDDEIVSIAESPCWS